MTSTVYDVLVVDDEPVLCRAIRKIVTRDGFSVDDADTATGGLERLKVNRYGMVLCDLMLSGIGGLGVLRSAHRVLGDMPVVMITGYATLGSAIESFESGAFDFLPKPFDDDELMAVVKRALAFHDLDVTDRRSTPWQDLVTPGAGSEKPVSVHALGAHSWVLLDSKGMATIGAGESFDGLRDTWRGIDVPSVGETIRQARTCARVATTDGLVHRLWAPLSGTIIDRNPTPSRSSPQLSDHWLLRIVPSELDEELNNLVPRWPQASAPAGGGT